MAQRVSLPSRNFTEWLLPRGKPAPKASAEDSLLPLVRHWLLAIITQKGQANKLVEEGELRKFLEVGDPKYWDRHMEEPIKFPDDTEVSAAADLRRSNRWTNALITKAHDKLRSRPPSFSHPIFANIQTFGDLLALNDTDRVVLCFLVLLCLFEPFHNCLDRLDMQISSPSELADVLARATGLKTADILRTLASAGALRSMGLIRLDCDTVQLQRYADLQFGIGPLLMTPHNSPDALVQSLLTPRQATQLTAQHFPHLTSEVSLLVDFLGAAMHKKILGTNILIYGPPGVGKTELASVVAQQLGAALYEVGYANAAGEPIRGTDRLNAYTLCQRLLARRTDVLVLFDEVEDMLEEGETPGKAWVNRALEENSVPAIWITNNERALDPAYLRRFDYSVHVTTPPKAVRIQIAKHYLQGIASDGNDQDASVEGDRWLESLVENPTLTPSQLDRAAKVAQLVEMQTMVEGGQTKARQRVEHVLDRSSSLLRQPKNKTGRPMATAYDLTYLHTDVSVPELVDSLRQNPAGTFCFYGPPGVGKTALAQHIAKQLELPLIQRRASDLLDCYLGGTEQKIAKTFATASAERGILLLDEADSFLQSRERAHHSWEVTQVNELLTQMEDFQGIFICTTNLVESLDPASLRRFDWKIRFKALTSSQRWALFIQEFHLLGGAIESVMHLQTSVRNELTGITPGDFAPVTRQYRLLRRTPSPEAFLQRLRAEMASRSTRNDGNLSAKAANDNRLEHKSSGAEVA